MNAVRKALESMYTDKLTVTEYQKVTDSITHVTESKGVQTLVDIPCRLSFQTVTSVDQDKVPFQTQIVKLFLAPEVVINPGSKITVQHAGVTTDYMQSGKPAVHTNHQEIVLELFDRYG